MYVCKRCNYETTLKANLIIHLKAIKECLPFNQDIDRKILIDDIEKTKREKKSREKHQCTTCNKEFLSKRTYESHIEQCVVSTSVESYAMVKLKEEINDLQNKHKSLQEKYASVEQQLQESKLQFDDLKKIVDSMIRINGNNNIIMNGNNITVNLHLRNFGEENMDALLDREIGDCFLNLQFKDMVEQLHYNEEYPENHNIRIKSMKRKMMEIYDSNKWNITSFKEGLPKLVIQIQKIFEDYAKRNNQTIKNEMTQDELIVNLDALNRIKNMDKKLINPIIKDLEILLEAKRNIIK
jgi:chaperonin cofactor prefoldin